MKKALLLLFLGFLIACSDIQGTATPTANETAVGSEDTPAPTQPANDEEETAVDQSDKIILQMAVYEWESGQYRDLIETFEAENPDIEIKTVSIEEILDLDPGGVGQWPEDAARRLASSADILRTNIVGTRQDGLLLDLRPLAEADPNFSRDDFYPNMLTRLENDGQLLGLPTQANFTLIFFQKDAFDAAGVPYPEPGWTWDDFLAAAQATTVREGGEVVQWGLVQINTNPFEFVLPRTGSLIDTSTDPPTPNFERPEVAEAMQWYADLYLLHEVAPNLEQPEPDEDGSFIPPGYELIENGQAAMWPEWSGSWEWRSSQMNLGVVPFPVAAPDDKTTQMFSDGLSISAGTQNPEAAWRWIDFLSRQPNASGFGQDTAVPARISVAEASGFWDNVDPELGIALAYALDHSFVMRFDEGFLVLSEAANAVLQDGKSVEEALADAQVEAETAASEAEDEPEEEEEEIVVAAPEVQEVPEDAVVILFVAGGGPGGLQVYRDLIDPFREAHPDIVVELETPDFGEGFTGLADVAADADCFQWFGGVSNPEDQAALLSIDPFFDADPTISEDDFYPQALTLFTDQGQLWGLPAEMNITVIMYNKALFDAAGVPYPNNGWTTDDFLETAVALTMGDDPETKQYGYVPQDFEINDLNPFLERRGAQLLDVSTAPPRLTLTHPDTVEAMRWVTSLTTEFAVKPTFITELGSGGFGFGEERKTLIENGRAAMWSDQGFQNFPEINLDSLDIGAVTFPASPEGDMTLTNSASGYFISATTEQRQACWEWITFLSERPLLNDNSNAISARPDIASSAAYADLVGAELAAANLATIENSTEPSITQRFSTDLAWLGLGSFWWPTYAYDQILNHDTNVEEILAEVQEKANAYRDCIIERDGFQDRSVQRACLGEADDTVPSFFVEE